jgi:putative hydrolases of HD superfamily
VEPSGAGGRCAVSQAVDDLVKLAEYALRFGAVSRLTMHPDGQAESDTTHTVMLVWVGCSLAARQGGLDVGMVAQLAAVHDAPEAFVGDTQTLRICPVEREQKEARERWAAGLFDCFDPNLSWVSESLRLYRRQELPEARFVRAVDKLVPKLTHLLNGCAAIVKLGMGAKEFRLRMQEQDAELEAYAGEFSELRELRRELVHRVHSRLVQLELV